MSKLLKLSIIILFWFFIFSLALTNIVAAESILPNPENVAGCDCQQLSGASDACQLACKKQTGNYEINDFIRIGIVIANFILGLVGSLALLAFIVGGLMWLLSGGKAEMVERGKQTILGAVIGLAIVFTSYMIIQLVFSALGIEGAQSGQNKIGSWAISNWTDIWPKSK